MTTPTHTPMTLDQLKATYGLIFRMLRTERHMRSLVFAKQPAKLQAKLAEVERAQAALEILREELKRRILEDANKTPAQGELREAPHHRYP
jgi:hypothetical protein